MYLTADLGVESSIQAHPHTFVEIDCEIISTVILLPSSDLRRVVVSYKQKYVHEVLVNNLCHASLKPIVLQNVAARLEYLTVV